MMEDKYITQKQSDDAAGQPLVYKNETAFKRPILSCMSENNSSKNMEKR